MFIKIDSMQIILTETTLFLSRTYELTWSLVLRSPPSVHSEPNCMHKDIKI